MLLDAQPIGHLMAQAQYIPLNKLIFCYVNPQVCLSQPLKPDKVSACTLPPLDYLVHMGSKQIQTLFLWEQYLLLRYKVG